MISEADSGLWYFYCFGCGERGNLNRLFWKFKLPFKLDYPKLSSLPKKQKLKLPERLDYTRGLPDYYAYFNSRGISDGVCRQFGFKFDIGLNQAVFPIYLHNKYLGNIRRHITGSTRYEIQTGLPISEVLWAYDAINPNETVYVTEGIIDAAIIWTAGLQAVALCNKTWVNKVKLLEKIPGRNLIYIPDNYDPQSSKTFLDMRSVLGGKLEFVPLPHKDIGEFITHQP